MSLVRLLKAGKSLTDLKNSTNRYCMRSRFLLPKFGSTKNPFSAPVPVEAIQAACEGVPVLERYQKSPAELSAARLKKTAKLPDTVMPETGPLQPVPANLPKRKGNWRAALVRWTQKLNPFGGLPKRTPETQPPTCRPGRPPVQAELTLDTIKVLRNDLSDADVEIVPATPPAVTKPEPARPKGRRTPSLPPALVETQHG